MAHNPYEDLPAVPTFELTSEDLVDGATLAAPQLSGMMGLPGTDTSPQLSWSGFPPATKSFVVTAYDPDAPTASGFWHWAVVDIPVTTTSLVAGAADDGGSGLPPGAFQLPNDAGFAGFVGAAPPKGHGAHHYYFVVHAVDVESLGISPSATPAYLGFNLFMHTLARAILVAKHEEK